jgi:hypothetical protein
VTVVGIAVALITGWLPADRFVTFGFAVPVLAALGLERIRERLSGRRLVGWVTVGTLTMLMLAGSAIAWNRQEAFMSEEEVRASTLAAWLAPVAGTKGPIAFLVDDADASVTFLASRAGNVIRASVPPERIRDVIVVVPPRDGADEVRTALELTTASDLRAAEAGSGREAIFIVLPPFFDPADAPEGAVVIEPNLLVAGEPPDPLEPASTAAIAWASLGALVLLWAVGFGCALGLADPVTAAPRHPRWGRGRDPGRGGARPHRHPRRTTAGAVAVSALAAGGGYLAWFVLERRAGRSSPQVQSSQPSRPITTGVTT